MGFLWEGKYCRSAVFTGKWGEPIAKAFGLGNFAAG